MKKITRRSFLAVCGTVAAAAALTACGGSASSATVSTASSAAGSTAASTLSGNVATGGSTSMKNVIAALTEGFAEVEPGVTVSYDPTGSGAGITGATDKTLDIGLSSRALKDDERNDVDGTTVALDGIAIIVNKDSKVADLTVDQLKQMFTGEITNWSEVGGDDGEIVLIGREAGSGTRDGFESIVDVKDSCKYAQELTATGAVISAVEANPLAIGYASLSAIGDTVKAVTVGGVECSEETVKDGSYEVQRPFVFVTNDSVTLFAQALAEALTALRALPPVEVLAHRLAGDGHGVQMQQAKIAQVEHHLRHATREEGAHGRVIVRAVGQHAYQARHPAVDARPVFNVRDRAARRVGDGWNVQQ